MSNLIINSQAVSQHNGLFSLNDLHKVSGGEPKHKPTNFMRNAEVQELIAEIEQVSDLRLEQKAVAYETVHGGNKKGTFVCRELVYRYAMWISPKFSLMVIRAFDALNTGTIPTLTRPKLSDMQAFTLQKAVKAKCGHNRSHYQTLYRSLYNEFKVSSYKDILADDFERAMAIVADFRTKQVPEIYLQQLNQVLGVCAIRLMEYGKLLSSLQQFGHIPNGAFNTPTTLNPAEQALKGLVDLAEQLGLRDEKGVPFIQMNRIRWYCGSEKMFDR